MMTLCKANEFCPLGLFAAIFGSQKIHRYKVKKSGRKNIASLVVSLLPRALFKVDFF